MTHTEAVEAAAKACVAEALGHAAHAGVKLGSWTDVHDIVDANEIVDDWTSRFCSSDAGLEVINKVADLADKMLRARRNVVKDS